MSDVIAIDDLNHAYRPGALVLRGVNLHVAAGEVVGMIGLSGAGKSTLLRCINGLVTQSSGTCRVFDQEVKALGEGGKRLLRRRIGMIFQEFNLVDRLSVLKNVLIGRLAYTPTIPSCFHHFSSDDLTLARNCIAQVGLAGLEHRRARDLSGGQKQRVAIARAMAQEAEIILADEATANLDVLTKGDIMDLLQDISAGGKVTIVLSMHDLDLARKYCTRILGLKQGAITFDSTPDALDSVAVADVLGRTVGTASGLMRARPV
jgi:phosphonate transport system ATP-binding protein